MKKIAAVLLLFTMIICSTGLLISYQLNLYSIHLQQREIILHSSMFQSKILSFAFPKNYADHENFDLEFEGDDELKFHGKMYDIVSRETSADTIYVKCISDESEDQLREEAGRQIDLNGGSSAHEHSFKIKFNPGVYDDNPGAEWNSLTTSASKIFFHFEISPPLFRYSNVPSPPPWHRI